MDRNELRDLKTWLGLTIASVVKQTVDTETIGPHNIMDVGGRMVDSAEDLVMEMLERYLPPPYDHCVVVDLGLEESWGEYQIKISVFLRSVMFGPIDIVLVGTASLDGKTVMIKDGSIVR